MWLTQGEQECVALLLWCFGTLVSCRLATQEFAREMSCLMVKKCDKDARSAEGQKGQAAFSLFRLLRKAPLLRTGVWQRCFSCVSGRAERLYRKNVPAEGLEIAQTGLSTIKDSSTYTTN